MTLNIFNLLKFLRGKNDYAKVLKNFSRYTSENNFAELSKFNYQKIHSTFIEISKFFAPELVMLEFFT